jgi:hypothetical protein
MMVVFDLLQKENILSWKWVNESWLWKLKPHRKYLWIAKIKTRFLKVSSKVKTKNMVIVLMSWCGINTRIPQQCSPQGPGLPFFISELPLGDSLR